MRIIRENKWLFYLLSFVLCICACFTLTSGVYRASANGTRGNVDMSFATVSQAAAIYVNTMTSPGYEGANELHDINAGNAGGFVGFVNLDNQDKNFALCSTLANVCVWSYDALGNIRENQAGSSTLKNSAGQTYAFYGMALAELGLDEVGTASDNTSTRMLIGIFMMALYVLAVGMSTFFNLIISILQAVNPFRMFASAVELNGWIDRYPTGAAGGGGFIGTIGSALNTFATQVGKIYDLAHNMSLFVLIPLFLAIAIFTWLIINKGQNFSKIFKPFAVRLLFVVLGVPLMFGTYDVILTSIMGSLSASGTPATKVMASLFCDMEAWVNDDGNSLSLPAGTTIKYNTLNHSVDGSSMANVRNICYNINTQSYSSESIFDAGAIPYSSDALMSYYMYDTAVLRDSDKPTYEIGVTGGGRTIADDAKTVGTVLGILQKYARGDKMSSALYASNVITRLMDQDDTGTVVLFNTSSTWQDYDDKQAGVFEHDGNDGGSGGTNGKNTNVQVNLTSADVSAIASERWKTSKYPEHGYNCRNERVDNIFGNGNLPAASRISYLRRNNDNITFSHCSGNALSDLAMYNYLNTDFTSTEVRVCSPTATNNDQLQYQHYAVSMVGNSFMKFIYFADAVVLLGAISIIGYGYGFAMLVGNFKALFKMIPNVLTGMLGSIRGIASALALMFAMICEVVGTILLFDIAVEILFAIYKIVELPFASSLSSGALSGMITDNVGSMVATGLLGVVSCVVIVSLSKQLLSWRTAIVGATTAACTQFVNKILNTNVNAPSIDDGGSGMLHKAGTAALAGASVAIGASRGLYGEDAKNAMNELKSKLSGDETREGIKSGLLSNDFGVKKGNGTGVTTGLSESDSTALGKESEMSAIESEIAESEKQKALADSERAGAGLTNTDTSSEAYVAANEADFESALDSDYETSSLVGDDATDKRRAGDIIDRGDVKEGTVTTTDSDGRKKTVETSVDGDGVVTTVTTTENADGGYTTSKLVEAGDMQYTTTDTYDSNGNVTHEESTLDKRTGQGNTVTRTTDANGTTVSNVSVDGLGGRKTTRSVGANGATTTEVEHVDATTGDRTISREITTKGGTTYVNETVHTDSSTGNVVTKRTTSGSGSGLRGGRQVVESTANSAGEVIHETSTTYSSSNNVVEREVKDVVQQNDTVTETHTKVSGGVTSTVVTKTNDVQGIQTKQYTTISGGVTTKNVETYTKQQDGSYTLQQSHNNPVLSNVGVARQQNQTIHNTVKQSGGTTTVVNTVEQEPNTVKQVNIFDSNAGSDTVFVSKVPTMPRESSIPSPGSGRGISTRL